MTKKVIKKKSVKKRIVKSNDKILIENFVSLQKVMTGLSENFNELSKKITNLLDLFEASAKALTGKEIRLETPPIDEKKILQGLENISEQNKVIARGLTLLHEPQRNQSPQQIRRPIQIPRLPRPRPPKQLAPQNPTVTQGESTQEPEKNLAEYEKSISSNQPSESQKFKKL